MSIAETIRTCYAAGARDFTDLPRIQCAKCPWKKSTDPFDIPNGYDPEKHAALERTIAKPGDLHGIFDVQHTMACHETTGGNELPCVGWLVHQLGPGNNIAMRLRATYGAVDANVRTVGPQHKTFADTLPKSKKPRVPGQAKRRKILALRGKLAMEDDAILIEVCDRALYGDETAIAACDGILPKKRRARRRA